MTDNQIHMNNDSRKMVQVDDLTVGMHVVELDKPWLELPFEPPFQLQGFRIQSDGEIEKIQEYCSHVHIDTERSAQDHKATYEKSDTPSSVHSESDTPSSVRSEGDIPSSIHSEGLFQWLRRKLRLGARKSGKRAKASIPQSVDPPSRSSESAGQGTISDYEELCSSKSDYRNLPSKYQSLASNAPNRTVYQNQTTFEEEYEPAKRALDDAYTFYTDMVGEVQKSRKLDYPKIESRVDSIAKSIIRNPDALSYLVHMKLFNTQTYNLAISSSVMVMAFARFLGLSDAEIKDLGTGALLQDVGMIELSSELLNKSDSLTDTEFKVVKRHVTRSQDMVKRIPGISEKVVGVCYYHHERYDGSGYPKGLKKNEIPLFPMITGIVDTYMALTSFRSYRRTKTSYEALSELTALKNKKFVGALVDRFIQSISIFPVGSFIQLNSGHIGIVVARNPMRFLEPKVMLVLDPAGRKMDKTLTINFATEQRSRFFEGLRILGEVIPSDFDINAEDFFA